MKNSMCNKINIINHIITVVLLIALLILALTLADNRLKTSFGDSSEVEMIINDSIYYVPVIEHTHVDFKTSDSSYVCLSRATMSDIYYYYLYLDDYDVEDYDRNSRIVVSNGHVRFEIVQVANDLRYTRYGIAILKQEN